MSEREEIQQLKAEKEALEARVKEFELDLAHINWICECKILHSNEESACPKCLCCNPGVGKIQALESKLEKAMKVVEAAKKFIDADNAHEGDWDALVDALTAFEKEGEKK